MDKLKSRTFWITIWAMALITWAVFTGFDVPWFANLVPILAATIPAYIAKEGYVNGKVDK